MTTRIGVNLAQIYANRGEYAKAEQIYRRVLAMTPDYPIARTNLAEVLNQQNKKAEAEAFLLSVNSAPLKLERNIRGPGSPCSISRICDTRRKRIKRHSTS